jgi:hypothetical protein
LNKGPEPSVHGEYLATKVDLERLNKILEETSERYHYALTEAENLPFLTKLTDWLLSVVSLGIVRPANRKTEIENKKRNVPPQIRRLILIVEGPIADLGTTSKRSRNMTRQSHWNLKMRSLIFFVDAPIAILAITGGRSGILTERSSWTLQK